MLAFDTGLSNALETHSTESFWVLKLFYNDDTVDANFVGVSDQDRVDGSDTYYGVVSSWGVLSHSLDFFNFTTSLMNMSVKLINTDNTIEGGRFSDLLSTNNFANRKWELFQNTGRAGTYDEPVRMIGTGIISGDFSYGVKSISLKLLDYTSKYNKQLPTAFIQNTASGDAHYYPNAPEKNIGKPIPMAYGDFWNKTDIGTIETSPKFDYFFTKGKFPAIVTDNINESDGYVYANGDSVVIDHIDGDNIYLYNNGQYIACNTSNTTTDNPRLKYNGTSWYLYIPMNGSQDNMIDGDFGTSYTLTAPATGSASATLSIPEIADIGTISSVDIIADYGAYDFSSISSYNVFGRNGLNVGSPLDTIQIQSGGAWGFAQSGTVEIIDSDGGGGASLNIIEMGVRVTLSPSKTFETIITEQYETASPTAGIEISHDEAGDSFQDDVVKTRTVTITTPTISDYIYFSGKGREYHSDISTRTTYGAGALCENPVYIIEDIMRRELGLTDSTIDTSSFDLSGLTDLANIFADAYTNVKFAFSQYKFIGSKDLINRICKQILSWVFISGDGKYKIKTLEASGWSANKTIDFNDCNLKSISRTSLGGVRNDITINYNKDYGQDQFLSSVNPTADSVSTLKTVAEYNQTLKMKMDADILDTTTATKLAEAYMAVFKDRKIIINFDCNRAKYNDLEIGDIIKFSNWDSAIKLYGVTLVESGGSTDYFIIQSISKKPNGSSIKAIKVS